MMSSAYQIAGRTSVITAVLEAGTNTHTHTHTHTHTYTSPDAYLPHNPHLVLFENPVNPEHVVQHLIEEHQGNVQFLLIEHLQPGLDVLSQFLPVHRKIVLGEPVTIENWARESSLWEMEGRGVIWMGSK